MNVLVKKVKNITRTFFWPTHQRWPGPFPQLFMAAEKKRWEWKWTDMPIYHVPTHPRNPCNLENSLLTAEADEQICAFLTRAGKISKILIASIFVK